MRYVMQQVCYVTWKRKTRLLLTCWRINTTQVPEKAFVLWQRALWLKNLQKNTFSCFLFSVKCIFCVVTQVEIKKLKNELYYIFYALQTPIRNKSWCLRAIDDKRTYPVQVLFSLRYDVCGSLQEHLCRINTIWIKVFGICRAFLLWWSCQFTLLFQNSELNNDRMLW